MLIDTGDLEHDIDDLGGRRWVRLAAAAGTPAMEATPGPANPSAPREHRPLPADDTHSDIGHAIVNTQERERFEDPRRLVLEMLSAQRALEDAVKALDKASRRAEHDPLTRLPTRGLFLGRFKQAAAHADRYGKRIALLFLDLDGFKAINDSHGHQVGDRVLKSIADCLAATVRKADTVSRYGGDEFLMLLTEIGDASNAARTAERIVAALSQAVHFDDRFRHLSASIGISVYPDDGTDLDTLLHRADMAMYRMKRRMREPVDRHEGEVLAEVGTVDRKVVARDSGSARDAGSQRAAGDRRATFAAQALSVASSAAELKTAVDRTQQLQAAFVDLLMQLLGETQTLLRESAVFASRSASRPPDVARLQCGLEQRIALASVLLDGALGAHGQWQAGPDQKTPDQKTPDQKTLARLAG